MAATIPVELIERARTQRSALDELVSQYNGFVLSLARARGVDFASSEDVAQDVWHIVERELPNLREPKAFLGWLARITEHTAGAVLRKGSRDAQIRRGLSERRRGLTSPPADEAPMHDEALVAVVKALRALPEDYRIPVILRFYQGMTAREIAEVMDCPLGTILSRLFRANNMLRERLKKHYI